MRELSRPKSQHTVGCSGTCQHAYTCGLQVSHPVRLTCALSWTATVCWSTWLVPRLCWRPLQLCSRSSKQLRVKRGTWQPGWQASTACKRQLQRLTGSCRCARCLASSDAQANRNKQILLLSVMMPVPVVRLTCTVCEHESMCRPTMHFYLLYVQVVEAVDTMADETVWFRMFSVNVRQAKFELTSRALAARHALQRWVQERWHASNTAQIAR